jgi:hypothetical protein
MIAHGISANSAGIWRSIGSIWISVGPEVYIQREVLQTTLIVQYSAIHIIDLRARYCNTSDMDNMEALLPIEDTNGSPPQRAVSKGITRTQARNM